MEREEEFGRIIFNFLGGVEKFIDSGTDKKNSGTDDTTKMEQEVNRELIGAAHFEVPKKIGLLEHDFSIERGELTPKLSVKRKVVDKSYKDVIDALYAGEHDGKM